MLLSSMSPANVDPVQLNGEAAATSVESVGAAATRTSPNRESPCTAPAVPSACPPSVTRPILMFAFTAHVWNARRISC